MNLSFSIKKKAKQRSANPFRGLCWLAYSLRWWKAAFHINEPQESQRETLPCKVLKHPESASARPAISCMTLLVQFFFCVDFQGLIPLLFLLDAG